MNRFLSIGEAAERLGVSITTLRRWEALGRLVPKRTQAGHRRYDAALIESLYKKKRTAEPLLMPEYRAVIKKQIWKNKKRSWSFFVRDAVGALR